MISDDRINAKACLNHKNGSEIWNFRKSGFRWKRAENFRIHRFFDFKYSNFPCWRMCAGFPSHMVRSILCDDVPWGSRRPESRSVSAKMKNNGISYFNIFNLEAYAFEISITLKKYETEYKLSEYLNFSFIFDLSSSFCRRTVPPHIDVSGRPKMNFQIFS